jgi:hypothetical protein
MNDLIAAAVGLCGAIIGSIVGSVATWRVTSYRDRSQFTYEFHREINDEKMMVHRVAAGEIMAARAQEDLGVLLDDIPGELLSVWAITGFYDRLYYAIKFKQLDHKLVGPLFGELFCFWYFGFFERQLVPVGWDISWTMKDLMETLSDLTPPQKWETWVAEGKRDAERKIKKYIGGQAASALFQPTI